ncbi:hypothetical protein MY4824_009232 [Beauveria thailandica]
MSYGSSPSPRKHYNRPYHMDERPRLVHDFLPSPPPRARHADSALSQSSNDGAVLPTMVLCPSVAVVDGAAQSFT